MTDPYDEGTALPICDFPDCGEVFESQRGLASHRKSHKKAIECPKCGKKVRYLLPHLRSEHDVAGLDGQILESVRALIEERIALREENAALRQELEQLRG